MTYNDSNDWCLSLSCRLDVVILIVETRQVTKYNDSNDLDWHWHWFSIVLHVQKRLKKPIQQQQHWFPWSKDFSDKWCYPIQILSYIFVWMKVRQGNDSWQKCWRMEQNTNTILHGVQKHLRQRMKTWNEHDIGLMQMHLDSSLSSVQFFIILPNNILSTT